MELVNELYAFCANSECLRIGQSHERVATVGVVERAGDGRRPEGSGRSAGPDDFSLRAAHGGGALGDAGPRRRDRRRRMARASSEAVAKAEEIVVPVQINGKVRARLTVPADTSRGAAARDCAVRSAGGRSTSRARRCEKSSSPVDDS